MIENFDTCYSGRLTINADNQLVEGQRGRFDELPPEEGLVSDMSEALGMNMGVLFGNRGYQGWYGKSTSGIFYTAYQRWTQSEWDALGEGDNLERALEYAINHQWWGFEDPCAPVNNFRFKGQGIFTDIILTGN